MEKCKLHASIVVGKKRKCQNHIIREIINRYSLSDSSLSELSSEIITEMFYLLSKNKGKIDSENIGRFFINPNSEIKLRMGKKVNWSLIEEEQGVNSTETQLL